MSRRLENMDPERQRALFDTAAREFAAHGFDGASLNRILEQSGMSKSSLYYYFDDKADLFTTMIERALAVMFREMGGLDIEALQAETFWDQFVELYRKAMAVTENNDWLLRFGGMFYQLRGTPKAGAATGHLFQVVRHWVIRIVERGQNLGIIRRDLPQPLLIDATMAQIETLDRWIVAHWVDLSEAKKAQLPHQHIDLFRRLLAN